MLNPSTLFRSYRERLRSSAGVAFMIGVASFFLVAIIGLGGDPEPPTSTISIAPITTPLPTTVAPTTTSTTTTSTTSTTTTLPPIEPASLAADVPCQEWLDEAVAVGWPNDPEILTRLLGIMRRESRCRPEARSATSDTGLLQLNDFWCERSKYSDHDAGWLGLQGIISSCADLFDPETNLRAGLAIYLYSLDRNGNGFHPWRYSGSVD